MTECVVYWIRREDHSDPLNEGYVGISTDLEGRLYNHKMGYGNIIVERASKKYDLIVDILTSGTVEECLAEELRLRPSDRIGWNIASGGGMPPSAQGRKWTDEQRNKYLKTITENNSNKRSIESRAKQSQTRKSLNLKWDSPPDLSGTIWWNNGEDNKRSAECPGPEWVEGRLKFKRYGELKTCPHCGKIGKGSGMTRFHFENCKKEETHVDD